jgi:YidC/Oxa1 family membrane protein insertase
MVQKGDAALSASSAWNVTGLQSFIEQLCLYGDMPWWQGIAITTVMLRMLMFPVVVYTMKNNVALMNIMPLTKVHQERITACKDRGDMAGQAEATKNLMAEYSKHGVGPFKGLKGILIQAPVFMTMFFAMRGLAAADPAIPSIVAGGTAWFTDLSVGDPFFILPVASVATMVLLIELGADGAQNPNPGFKMFFRALAVGVLAFTYDFPAIVFMYWCTNNSLSLAQTMLLKLGPVRNLVGIPLSIKHAPEAVTAPKNDFSFKKLIDQFKAGMDGGNHNSNVRGETARSAAIDTLRKNRKRRMKRR